MKIRRCCTRPALLVWQYVISGQSAESVDLSAGMAVEMAMKNNYSIKALEHQQKQAEYDIKSAKTGFCQVLTCRQ